MSASLLEFPAQAGSELGGAHDVVIIGAGPAGSTLAARLAGRGFQVLLCDRGRFPRDKLCGEFLSPESLSSLDDLGVLDRIGLLGPAPIRRLVVTAPSAAPVERELQRAAIGLSRRQLDTLLVTAAWSRGARLREGCRVLRVSRAGGLRHEIEVDALVDGRERRLRARAVVDAAGRHGGIDASRAARARGGGHVAFKRHHVAASPASRGDAVEIHVFDGGYCGVAPVESGRVNVCFIGRAELLREAGNRPESMLARAGRQNPALAERLSELVPLDEGFLSTAGIDLAGRGPTSPLLLEVGDAAGMIAPLCGDGMAMAMRSACLAGEALHGLLEGRAGWDETLAAYQSAWRAEFRGRLRLGALAHAALLRPRLAGPLLRLGTFAPPLVDLLVRRTRHWERGVRRDLTAGI